MGTLEGCVVKVLSRAAPDDAIGTGILVSDELVLTCAHVAAEALGDRRKAEGLATELIGEQIQLEIGPLTAMRERRMGVVESWYPMRTRGAEHEIEDVAIVRLERRATLVPTPHVWMSHTVGTPGAFFGFGRYADWVECKAMGHGEHWTQLKCIDHEAEPGYSGAPVFNSQHTRIMGMLVARDAGRYTARMIPSALLCKALPISIARERATSLADILTRLLDRSTHYEAIREGSSNPYSCFVIEGCIADAPGYLAERISFSEHIERCGLERLAVESHFGPLHLKYSRRLSFLGAMEDQCPESLPRWLSDPGLKVVQLRPERGVDLIKQMEWIRTGFKDCRARNLHVQGRLVVLLLLHTEAHHLLKRWRLKRWLANAQDSSVEYLPPLSHVEPIHVVRYVEDLPALARRHFRQRFSLERVSEELNELGLRVKDPQRYTSVAPPLRDLLISNYQVDN